MLAADKLHVAQAPTIFLVGADAEVDALVCQGSAVPAGSGFGTRSGGGEHAPPAAGASTSGHTARHPPTVSQDRAIGYATKCRTHRLILFFTLAPGIRR